MQLRLKENFKVFVSGPSRCGKTVFISKLLENIHTFAKVPTTKVLYVFEVWQPKYDEMHALGVNFMEDRDNIVDDIKTHVSGEPIFVSIHAEDTKWPFSYLFFINLTQECDPKVRYLSYLFDII